MPATPSAEVTLQVAANSAAAQLEMFSRKFKQMQKEMAEATKKTGQESKQSGASFSGWSSDILKASIAIYAMHAPMKALHTVAQMIADEWKSAIQVAEGFKNRQVPYQMQLMNMMFNMPGNEDVQAILPQLDQMIKNSKVADKSALARIVESAASSTVDMPYLERAKIAVDIAETRPDLMAFDQASLESLSKAVVYNQKAFEKKGSTTFAQQGVLQAAKSAALIQENERYFNTLGLVPGQIAATFGDQYGQNEVLAFLSALNIAAGDTQGNITATQSFNFLADLFTKFATVPEMKSKTLNEQIEFLQGSDPRAERIRSELLASMEKNFGGLSEDEEMILEMANLGMPEALRELKDKPDITGRARSKFAVMGLIQPKAVQDVAEGAFDIKKIYQTLLRGEAGAEGLGELPIVADEKGRVDESASYRLAEQMLKQRVSISQNAKAFETANLETAVKIAQENIDIDAAEAIRGLRGEMIKTMKSAGGSATYYENEWLSPFMWREAMIDTDNPQAIGDYYQNEIARQITTGVFKRGMGEVKPVYPKNMSIWDQIMTTDPREPAAKLFKQGYLSQDQQEMYGLSDQTVKNANELYKLWLEIERIQNPNKPEVSPIVKPRAFENENKIQLDEETKAAVQQITESLNGLLDSMERFLSGEKPLPVRDLNKPRTEPSKGDWAP
jgi:hypothetical protein